MRLAAVIRVSRVAGREGVGFISVDVQRAQIEAYAKARGHEVVAWFEDLDQPGSRLKRPGMDAARALVAAGEADGLIGAKLDRLTRSIVDLGTLLREAGEQGWNLVVVDVGLDLASPNGKLVAHVLGAVAEWELDRRRSDWNVARQRAVARGVHVASRTPTGYLRGDDGRLQRDPATADAVEELFRRRAAGDGWGTLARMLTERGILTPYGHSTWTATSARKLVTNRVYRGEARSGVFVHPDAHQALVPQDVWERAQQPVAIATPRSGSTPLLAGLLRCSGCRYVMKGDQMRRDWTKGEQLLYYRCRRTHAAGVCPSPSTIMARVIEPYVEEQFLAWLASAGPEAQGAVASCDLEEASRALDLADAELLAYLDSEAVSILGSQQFEHGLKSRRQRVDAAREAMIEARGRVPMIGALTSGEIARAWPSLNVGERSAILRSAYDAVVVWPHRSGRLVADRVTLVERGDAPAGLPQRGRRVPLAGWPDDRPRDVRVAVLEDA